MATLESFLKDVEWKETLPDGAILISVIATPPRGWPYGAWRCGYVVLPTHVVVDTEEVDVHGGISFNQTLSGRTVIGFDCCKFSDLPPFPPKELDFVQAETKRLHSQLMSNES